ncbi:MAG: type II toxin-antitoxin system MqsA family antitoxin [Bacteroidota bacterium]
MKKKYSDCFYCGGVVKEQLISRELRWKGVLFIIENVPAGVCMQCGEKFLKPQVVKMIDEILQQKKKPVKNISVPVYLYGSLYA